jgi:sporulation protein YlmC with PRC-barrel domain
MTVTGPDTDLPAHYGALSLLDHQMIDRHGRACGNVDDLEFETREDGSFELTAILAGPGVLANRLGWPRFAHWLRASAGDRGIYRIPFWRVAEIDSRIRLSVDDHELATFHRERWTQDHIIVHIPGNRAESDGAGNEP